MAAKKLDPSTRNNDIGLYWSKTRRIDPLAAGLPYAVGEVATGLVAGTAGIVVYTNALTGDDDVMSFEAGEWKPIVFTDILFGATIEGIAETTTATNMFWTTTSADIGTPK